MAMSNKQLYQVKTKIQTSNRHCHPCTFILANQRDLLTATSSKVFLLTIINSVCQFLKFPQGILVSFQFIPLVSRI